MHFVVLQVSDPSVSVKFTCEMRLLQFNVVRRSRWTEPSGASLGKCFFLASFADILDHSSCPGSLDNVRYHVYRPLSGFLHEKVLPHTLRQFSIDQWQRSRRGSIYGVVHVYRVQTSPSFTCAVPHLMDLLLREARAIIIEDCTCATVFVVFEGVMRKK